jgi:DHA2 family multidrug resistance protein
MSGALAPTIGPTLGGWITETYSWHWLFFINVVPGVTIISFLPFLGRVDDPNPSLLRNFDLPGLGLLAIALASLEYVLEEGYRWGWLDDPDILDLTWISIVAGGLFLWRSLQHPNPVVDFRALKNRTFAIATLFIFVTGFGSSVPFMCCRSFSPGLLASMPSKSERLFSVPVSPWFCLHL